jgi:dipeptidyl aminopeptidase/acylaminoacyl peptidase
MAAKTTSHGAFAVRDGKVFALRKQPPKQQPFLVVMPAADKPDEARVLLDPNELDKKGTTAIDWFVPSWDGKLVAVSISKGGSESGDVHVFDVATGKPAGEVVPRASTAARPAATSRGQKTTRGSTTRATRATASAPAADLDFYQQLYFHALGTSARQGPVRAQARICRASPKSKWNSTARRAACWRGVQNGDSGEFLHFVRSPEGKWRQFAEFKDAAVQAAFGPKDDLFVVSRKDAPKGKVLHLSAAEPDLAKAQVVIPAATTRSSPTSTATPAGRRCSPPPRDCTSPISWAARARSGASHSTASRSGARSSRRRWVGPRADASGRRRRALHRRFVHPAARGVPVSRAGRRDDEAPLASPPVVDLSDVKVVREFARARTGRRCRSAS